MRVGAVERNADADRFAVAEPVVGQLFELVRGPVAEVERPRRPVLERIAAGGDVLRGAARRDRRITCSIGGQVASDKRRGVLLEKLEERGIPDERGLDRLRDPAAPVAVATASEKRDVVDHRERRREGAEVVLLAERVDAVLDAHRRIVLREHGGRHANEPDAAMRGRRGKARGVEHRAAADRDHDTNAGTMPRR